jgi:hypothetical protein
MNVFALPPRGQARRLTGFDRQAPYGWLIMTKHECGPIAWRPGGCGVLGLGGGRLWRDLVGVSGVFLV